MTESDPSNSTRIEPADFAPPPRRSLSFPMIFIMIVSNILLIALLIGLLVFGRNEELQKHHRLAILLVSLPGIGFGLVGIAFAVAQFIKRLEESKARRQSST